MADITCAISGLKVKSDYMTDLIIPHTAGYFHPIFAAEYRQLQQLYSQHCKGNLSHTDSYLLFLAFIHYTGQVEWRHPVTLTPSDTSTVQLIENNIAQLVGVIAKTDAIRHPAFKQPDFAVTLNNCQLRQIKSWIIAWEENIIDFHTYKADSRDKDALQKIENELTKLIYSGEPISSYAFIVADWAANAGDFPAAKKEYWKRIIRSCFNNSKMFATPLADIKELKDYCECNIDVGSIHFHTLSEVLRQGIGRHLDYLGGSPLALGYKIMSEIPDKDVAASIIKTQKALDSIVNASYTATSEPKSEDFSSTADYIRARLTYRLASRRRASTEEIGSTDYEL